MPVDPPENVHLEHFPYPSRRMPVMAAHGVVATSQPLAAQAGLQMLQRGGNAVDAAIATAITLTVVEPTSNGIGSDAFALVWDGTRLHGLNGSGRAPATHTPELFARLGLPEIPEHGWLPVTVPGAPAAWRDLHARFGRLPFATLFEPAIDYAEEGYPAAPIMAQGWARAVDAYAQYSGPEFAGVVGDLRARGPRAAARRGARAARTTRRRCAASPRATPTTSTRASWPSASPASPPRPAGTSRAADLAAHTSTWVEPIGTAYRGYEVWEIPPNGQGISALVALNILEGFDLAALAARVGRELPPADRGHEAGLRRRLPLRRRPRARRGAGARPARQGLRRGAARR